MNLRVREMRSEEVILVMNIFIPLPQRTPEQVAAVLPPSARCARSAATISR